MARGSTRPTSRDVARPPGSPRPPSPSSSATSGAAASPRRTAERVREAARELGYRPNLAARNLRLGHTRTVLLVVPALTTEFFAGVYTGAARVAAEHGFGVVLYPSPEGIGPARDPFASAQAALDGVIASSMAADALTAIRGDQLPLVMLDSDPDGSLGAATVNLDITDGVRQVADHLLGPRPPPLPPPRRRHALLDLRRPRPRTRRTASPHVPGTDPAHRPRRPITIDGALRPPPRPPSAGPGPRPTAARLRRRQTRRRRLQGRSAAWACASPTTSPSPASTTSPSPPPSTPNSPPCDCDAELFGERGMQALLAVLDGRTPDAGRHPRPTRRTRLHGPTHAAAPGPSRHGPRTPAARRDRGANTRTTRRRQPTARTRTDYSSVVGRPLSASVAAPPASSSRAS